MLRFETNKSEPGVKTSLAGYISRMQAEQKEIYFFAAPSRDLAMNSPYFEAIKKKDYEILFLFEPYDEMIVMQLNQFKGKQLTGIEQESRKEKNTDDTIIEGDARSLSNAEAQELKNWFQATLSTKIKNVKVCCHSFFHSFTFFKYFVCNDAFQRKKIRV